MKNRIPVVGLAGLLLLAGIHFMVEPWLLEENISLKTKVAILQEGAQKRQAQGVLAQEVLRHEGALKGLQAPQDRIIAGRLLQGLAEQLHITDSHYTFHPMTNADHHGQDYTHSLVTLTMAARADQPLYQMVAAIEQQLGGLTEPKEFVISREEGGLFSCLYTFDWITLKDDHVPHS